MHVRKTAYQDAEEVVLKSKHASNSLQLWRNQTGPALQRRSFEMGRASGGGAIGRSMEVLAGLARFVQAHWTTGIIIRRHRRFARGAVLERWRSETETTQAQWLESEGTDCEILPIAL